MKDLYQKTLRLTGTYVAGNLFRKGVQIVLIPFYTTYLLTGEYGVLAMMNVAVAFLAVLIEMPLVGGALERFYYHPEYVDKNGRLLLNLFLVLLAETAVVVLGYLALSELINGLLLDDVRLLGLTRLYAGVVMLWPVWVMMLALIKLREMVVYYVIVSAVGTVLMAGTAIYGLAVLHKGVYAVAVAQIVEYGSVAIMGLPVFFRHVEWKLDWGILRQPLRYGYPLLPTGMTQLAMRLLDRYILKAFRGMGEMGIYSFGVGIAEGVDSAVTGPLCNGVLPTFRQMESQPEKQKQFVRHAATMYYTVAIFVGLVVSLVSWEAVRILGRNSEFWAAQVVIPFVAMAFVQQSLGLFADWGMVMRSKSYHISAILVVTGVVNLGLDLLLVPRWGMVGAAVAMLCAYVAWNAMKMYFSAKFYDLHFDLRRLVHVTLIGAGLYLLSLPLAEANLMLAIGCKIGLAAAFPLVCVLTGLFSPEEKAILRAALARVLGRNKVPTAEQPTEETSPRK